MQALLKVYQDRLHLQNNILPVGSLRDIMGIYLIKRPSFTFKVMPKASLNQRMTRK
jgi:hypothetical protein